MISAEEAKRIEDAKMAEKQQALAGETAGENASSAESMPEAEDKGDGEVTSFEKIEDVEPESIEAKVAEEEDIDSES